VHVVNIMLLDLIPILSRVVSLQASLDVKAEVALAQLYVAVVIRGPLLSGCRLWRTSNKMHVRICRCTFSCQAHAVQSLVLDVAVEDLEMLVRVICAGGDVHIGHSSNALENLKALVQSWAQNVSVGRGQEEERDPNLQHGSGCQGLGRGDTENTACKPVYTTHNH